MHPIWAAHPRTHLSTEYPPPPGATILNIVSQFKPQVWNESKEFEISKIHNFWQIKITLQTINSLLSKYMLYPWILNRWFIGCISSYTFVAQSEKYDCLKDHDRMIWSDNFLSTVIFLIVFPIRLHLKLLWKKYNFMAGDIFYQLLMCFSTIWMDLFIPRGHLSLNLDIILVKNSRN